jgi:hypothetical protein
VIGRERAAVEQGLREGANGQVGLERSRWTRGWSGLTWRSLLLGFVLACGLAALTPYNDYVVGNTYIAGNHFPIGAVFVLLVLSLLSLAVYRIRGRPLLHVRELAVIYIIIMVTSGIPSSGLLRYLVPVMTTPFYYASTGNQWAKLFHPFIPPWLAVSDPAAANWFWEGLPEGNSVPWGDWLYTLSHWCIFIAAMWLMMFSLASLVRKQWADRERLAFPLVQFPLEVLRVDERGPSAGFFGNRLVWIGAGLVFVVHIINGLHVNFPAIPQIPTFWDLNQQLPDRPWNAVVPVYLGLFFSAVGFGYLLPLEVAAGFWVSVIYIKVQAVLLSALGYEGSSAWGGVISEIGQQEQMGSLLVLAGVFLWLLRGTFADAFRRAFGRAPEVDDRAEALGYRFAIFGLIAGIIAMAGWLWAAGMTPAIVLLFLVSFIAICLVLTRIIAEAGMLMIHLSFAPTDYLLMLGGTNVLGPANLTVLTFVDCALTFDLREFLMPSVLNGFRMAEQAGVSTRKLSPILAVALVTVLVVAAPVFLITFYKPGAIQVGNVVELAYHPTRFFATLGTRLQNPEHPTLLQYVSMVAGGLIVAGLAWLRLNFVWWPVHPLGFVMATSWASLNLWFSLFLGWLFKLLTIRYTGLRGYVQFRPLFLGIIMGDVMGGVLWQVVGFFTKVGIMVTVN